MTQLVHVRIEDCCRTDPYLNDELTLLKGDACIVQTERGTELGTVVYVQPVDAPPAGVNGQRRIDPVVRRSAERHTGPSRP